MCAMRTWMKPCVYAAWLVTPFRLWNNICICKYSIVICTTGFYRHLRYYSQDGLDGQWETSTVKSNYFRFATITLNFTHNELSNIVDFKLSDYHCGLTLTSLFIQPRYVLWIVIYYYFRLVLIFLPNIQDGRQWPEVVTIACKYCCRS